METLIFDPSTIHNGVADSAQTIVSQNSDGQISANGMSVGYTLNATTRYWFPIRATHRRAQKIYDKLVSINDGSFEPYLPLICHIEYSNEDFKNPTQEIKDKPLDSGLLFLRTTPNDFRALLKYQSMFPGMTPYYNHFFTNSFGKNDFLTVPDRQMQSFRIIVESGNENIIVEQNEIPEFVVGDSVVVIGGPFAGVEGIVMKYKHQKRVFVELQGVGRYATAYVPGAWIRKVGNG
ncbi:MAG: KOW motif-containing protein [Bacteroidales bacterium]|nr:KOW motif-containing protein [Bacteroidales bacterium]